MMAWVGWNSYSLMVFAASGGLIKSIPHKTAPTSETTLADGGTDALDDCSRPGFNTPAWRWDSCMTQNTLINCFCSCVILVINISLRGSGVNVSPGLKGSSRISKPRRRFYIFWCLNEKNHLLGGKCKSKSASSYRNETTRPLCFTRNGPHIALLKTTRLHWEKQWFYLHRIYERLLSTASLICLFWGILRLWFLN